MLGTAARAAEAEEPPLSPGVAVAIPASITLGLGGTAALALGLSDNRVVVGLGGSVAIIAAFSPEIGYYATGHLGRGIGMFFLRNAVVGFVGGMVGLGIWTAYDPCGEDSDPFCGLTAFLAEALGILGAELLFLPFEWWDTFAVVEADWERHRGASAEPPEPGGRPVSVALLPALLDPGAGSRVPGFHLHLLW